MTGRKAPRCAECSARAEGILKSPTGGSFRNVCAQHAGGDGTYTVVAAWARTEPERDRYPDKRYWPWEESA